MKLAVTSVKGKEAGWITIFFFNDTATTEIYTLSLHDALPIWFERKSNLPSVGRAYGSNEKTLKRQLLVDRKSTRLNSSHSPISYAVFCLKKKKVILRIKMSGQTNERLCGLISL